MEKSRRIYLCSKNWVKERGDTERECVCARGRVEYGGDGRWVELERCIFARLCGGDTLLVAI